MGLTYPACWSHFCTTTQYSMRADVLPKQLLGRPLPVNATDAMASRLDGHSSMRSPSRSPGCQRSGGCTVCTPRWAHEASGNAHTLCRCRCRCDCRDVSTVAAKLLVVRSCCSDDGNLIVTPWSSYSPAMGKEGLVRARQRSRILELYCDWFLMV